MLIKINRYVGLAINRLVCVLFSGVMKLLKQFEFYSYIYLVRINFILT